MKIYIHILSILLISTALLCGGCHKQDSSPEQKRYQRIAQEAFRGEERTSPAGHRLFCMVITQELEPGYELITETMSEGLIITNTYVTTQMCIYVSREEEPDERSPARPLYFESSIIPLSDPKSRIKIWEGTNIRSLVTKEPSGKIVELGATSF